MPKTNKAFEEGLLSILSEYTEEDWGNGRGDLEPLDGDEVDVLTERLRNRLNLINGNITEKEYQKLECDTRTGRLQIGKFKTTAKEFAFDGCHKFYIFEDEKVKKELLAEDWEEKEFYPISELQNMFTSCQCSLKFIERCFPFGGIQTIVPQFQNYTTFCWVH